MRWGGVCPDCGNLLDKWTDEGNYPINYQLIVVYECCLCKFKYQDVYTIDTLLTNLLNNPEDWYEGT